LALPSQHHGEVGLDFADHLSPHLLINDDE